MPLDVQCKFMFKSGCKIVSYSHFKILAQECTGWGDGIDPEFFVLSFYISVAIKASLLKFNQSEVALFLTSLVDHALSLCQDLNLYHKVNDLSWFLSL